MTVPTFNFNRYGNLLPDSDFQGINSAALVLRGYFANNPRYFGRALSETVGLFVCPITASNCSWGSDDSHLVSPGLPWMERGGASDDGGRAGIFSFNRHGGGTGAHIGFRPIIAGS